MGRALWSGSISFGLVNIPVKLHAAVRDRDVHFHTLSEDGGCRLRRKLVCPDTGREYDFDRTAKGYEVAPGQYVIVTPEELEGLRPERGRAIEIERFVALDDIDPMLFDRPYYLVPDRSGSKPYRLLLEALAAARKVAVARIVMRTKEYLAVVRPIGDALCLETLRYADEVVAAEEIEGLPEDFEIGERELEMADQLIEHLTTSFDATDYRDEFRERMLDLIDAKAAGESLVVQEPSESPDKGKVINLMEALRRSLEGVDSGEPLRGDKTQRGKDAKRSAARSERGGERSGVTTGSKKTGSKKSGSKRTTAASKPAAKRASSRASSSRASSSRASSSNRRAA